MLKSLPSDVWDYVRDAPGTYIWLAVLLATTVYLRRLAPERAAQLLQANSTNLNRLRQNPFRVLITSAFFTAGTSWPFYLVMYSLFQAPAEHFLGTWRWLALNALAHVGATLISQSYVATQIKHGKLPASARDVPDYGVSYALAGAATVLVCRIPFPWWIPYLVVILAYYLRGLLKTRDFTAVGHACAALIGLACFWLAP